MSTYNLTVYQTALDQCMKGPELEERGQKYRTWDAASITFDSNHPILFNFPARKLNVKYAVEEFLWYVRADKNDDSITEHATMWKKLKQDDGSFFSNYGQYIFRKFTPDGISLFRFAYEELVRNHGTRRAAIPLLQASHCFHANSDMVCTFAIQFFIRNGYLNMIVNMRSNDAVWGLTNDAFCFCMLHRMMYGLMREVVPNLRLGVYIHTANTLHVYERHYEMAKEISETDVRMIEPIHVPLFEVDDLAKMVRNETEGLKWLSFLDSSTS